VEQVDAAAAAVVAEVVVEVVDAVEGEVVVEAVEVVVDVEYGNDFFDMIL
jgi:hypothetical protein